MYDSLHYLKCIYNVFYAVGLSIFATRILTCLVLNKKKTKYILLIMRLCVGIKFLYTVENRIILENIREG